MIYPFRVPVKGPEAKLKGGCEAEGAFTGTMNGIFTNLV